MSNELQLQTGAYRTTFIGTEIVRESTQKEWRCYGEILRRVDEAKQAFKESLNKKIEHNKKNIFFITTYEHVILDLNILLVGDGCYISAASYMKELKKALGPEGVYVIRYKNLALYVGETRNKLPERLRGHISNKSSIGQYIKQNGAKEFTIEWYKTTGKNQIERRRLERKLINLFKPIFNEA